jgi:putative hydrolase of the HAD superfamily
MGQGLGIAASQDGDARVAKIEAVIWDFGGVFTTSPFEAFNAYEAAHGLPHDLIRSVNRRDPDTNAWALFERTEIDAAGFDTLFLKESTALGHPLRGAEVLPLISGRVRPAVVGALKTCKEHFKVGCITNNMKTGKNASMASSEEGASATAAIFPLFDHIIQSSEAGVRKPDPRIYLMMCEALAVKPQACVYLDDLGVNCKPAAALGMTAIKVVGETQLLDDLEKATGLRFER